MLQKSRCTRLNLILTQGHSLVLDRRLKTSLWKGMHAWRASRAILDETEYTFVDLETVGKEVRSVSAATV